MLGPFGLTFELDQGNASQLSAWNPFLMDYGGMNITSGNNYTLTISAFNSTGALSQEVPVLPSNIVAIGLCKEPVRVRFCLHDNDPDELCQQQVERTSLVLLWSSPKDCAAFRDDTVFDVEIFPKTTGTPVFKSMTFSVHQLGIQHSDINAGKARAVIDQLPLSSIFFARVRARTFIGSGAWGTSALQEGFLVLHRRRS